MVPSHLPAGPNSAKRLLELDALRGVAAVSVVMWHFTECSQGLLGSGSPTFLSGPWLSWAWPFRIGGHGVALFFIISGFVILMTLERTKTGADFLQSRAARLFPAYIAAVCVTSLVRRLVGDPFPGLVDVATNFTMMPSVFGVSYVDGVYWSLEIELRFYLLMYVVYLLRWLPRIEWHCLAWLGLAIAAKLAVPRLPPSSALDLLLSPLLLPHAMLFSAGMCLYRIYQQGFTPVRTALLAACVGATIASGKGQKAAVVVMAVVVLLAVIHGRLGFLRRSRSLLVCGELSYALYLVHGEIGMKIIRFMFGEGVRNIVVLLVVPTVVSFGVAYALHRLVEKPAARAYATYRKRRAQPEARTLVVSETASP